MKLLKKVCFLVMICAMMLGASSLLTACKNQNETNTTIETKQVVADPEYEVKSYDSFLSYGHGLYYEEVDPSDRRSTDELPAEYTQIEYLESTGKQYIETGYTPNEQTQIECSFYLPSGSFYYSADSADKDVFYSNKLRVGYTILSWGWSTNSNQPPRLCDVELFLSATRYTCSGGSTVIDRSFSNTNFTNSDSLRIFKGSENSSYKKRVNYSQFKLYTFKISEKDPSTSEVTYVRDFVPCVKDNICGLFDVVEQKFYENADGNGSFNVHNDMQGSGTENDPYQISSVEDLLMMNGTANGNEYYVITQDIEFNDGYFERNQDGSCTYHDGGDGILYDWAPPFVFFRKIDGQGHKIKNFYSSHSGIFNVFKYGENASSSYLSVVTVEVSNIEVANAYFTDNNVDNNVAGIGGSILLVTYRDKLATIVSNCKVDAYIYFSNCSYNVAFILSRNTSSYTNTSLTITNCISRGNLIAYSGYGISTYGCSGAKISNCVNYANITARAYAAGILQNSSNISHRSVVYMDNCKNYGNITGFYCAGGIGVSDEGEYKSCYNYGKVTATNSSTASNAVSQASGIIVASSRQPDYENYKFYSCYNEGDVNAYAGSAGISLQLSSYRGVYDEYFEKCVNKGNIFSSSGPSSGIAYHVRTAKECVNSGKILGGIASGLFYYWHSKDYYDFSIINCKNYGYVKGNSEASGIIGNVTQSDTKMGYLLNCINEGQITSLSNNATGVVATSSSSAKFLTIRNCVNKGKVFAGGNNRAIGIANSGSTNFGTSDSKFLIENCVNEGDLEGKYCAGITSFSVTGARSSFIVRNCLSTGNFYRGSSASSYYTIYSSTGVSNKISVVNCIGIGKVMENQQGMKQFWGNDFSAFFVHRMTGRIGLKELEGIGRYMLPIPSASYLENDLNFTRVA